MSESTRAPWAAGAASAAAPAPAYPAPGAGASVTRAPWATAGGGEVGTRAPWAQGVSIGAPVQDKVDFDAVAKLHPEYTNSIQAAKAVAAVSGEAAAAPSAASSDAATAAARPGVIYSPPSKMIKTPAYMSLWPQTQAHAELMSFILLLNERIRGVPCALPGVPTRKYTVSPRIKLLVDWLDESREAIARIPPLQQAMRFGNKAFRTWHAERVGGAGAQGAPGGGGGGEHLAKMLTALVGPELAGAGAVAELLPYAQDAFGSVQRIDYGTGHELNFVLLLCALNKLGVFTAEDLAPLVLEVFQHYLTLMQTLQRTYWLEPAGSKGAWGLDDYQFLVFLWGSSQLLGSSIAPGDILKEAVVEAHAERYLFLRGIRFIHTVKTGPFEEHSAYLHQISQLASWQKANQGLLRMYEAEVLHKFPIVQHVLFGRILRFERFDRTKDKLGAEEVVQRAGAIAAAAPKPTPPRFDDAPAPAEASSTAAAEAPAPLPTDDANAAAP